MQQESPQQPDCGSLAVVFPQREWKCSMKDDRYVPAPGPDQPFVQPDPPQLSHEYRVTVFPQSEWKCRMKDGKYVPVLIPIQESGHNQPDELV